MKKSGLILFLAIFLFQVKSVVSQNNNPLKIFISDSLQFEVEGEILNSPFTGGLNNPTFAQVDLNNDGKPDIVAFDRSGDITLTFINTGTNTNYSYEYAPQYEFIFNQIPIMGYIKFEDFNQDGKPDLFTIERNNIFRVYENVTQSNDTILKLRKMGDLMFQNTTDVFNRLGVRKQDLPVIIDVDGDGDLDYGTYESVFGNLQFYLNEQVEKGLPNDTFAFRLVDLCWGGFVEAAGPGNELVMECNRLHFPNYTNRRDRDVERRHAAGTALMMMDMDNDGDMELFMSNAGFSNILYMENGRTDFGLNYDTIISYKGFFPTQNEHEINMKYVPAMYHFDVDGDGVKDIIAAPYFLFDNVTEQHSIYNENVWFLKNEGTNENPFFKIYNKNFLMENSIDLGAHVSPVFWDINNNGLIDLLVAVEPDTVKDPSRQFAQIYRYDNIGTSNSPKYKLVDTDFANFSQYEQRNVVLAIGDLDGDGLDDIVFGNRQGTVIFLKNTSASNSIYEPSFVKANDNLLNGNVGGYSAPAMFDYSRDGKLDLIVGKKDGFFSYYENTSDSNNIEFTLITEKFGNVRTNLYRDDITNPMYEAVGMSQPLFYDFEGDGKPELISGTTSGHIKMWQISYDPFYTFPEVTDFYGNLNAYGDTVWGLRMGTETKIAAAKLKDSTNVDILVGTNRGGFKYYSSKAGLKKVGVNQVPKQVFYFKLYPNPNKGEFMVVTPAELTDKHLTINILDYTGKMIFAQELKKYSDNIVKIDVADGIYFGQIIDENNIVVGTSKIIISSN